MKRFLLIATLALLVAAPVLASPIQSVDEGAGWMTVIFLGAAGMVVNSANLKALFTGFNTIFNDALAASQPQWKKIAMAVPSTTRSNNYAWMASLSGMREWIGDRQITNLKAYIYEILNKTWENTIGVPREDIEDDQYAVYGAVVRHQAATVAEHPDDLVFALLNNGFTAKAYDGKAYFATDHEFGSNKATYPLTPENYGKALAALGKIKKANGDPFFTGSEKTTLVTGALLQQKSLEILNSQFISVANGSTQDNVWKGTSDYLKSPRITSDTAWFIMVEFQGLMGLVFQNRRDPKFTQITDPDSEAVYKTNQFEFGVDARYNAGYGLPQLAFGSTGLG